MHKLVAFGPGFCLRLEIAPGLLYERLILVLVAPDSVRGSLKPASVGPKGDAAGCCSL